MRPCILLISLCACSNDLADRADEASRRAAKEENRLRHERGELTRQAAAYAHAQIDFESLRSIRVTAVRAEHSVYAMQPLLIATLANITPMTPARRAQLDENLVIFRQRLANTRDLIETLATASAREWEARDDEVGRAMAGMFVARDASWNVLEGKRDDAFPET